MLSKAFIPYGGYYSTPFCKWQGTFANENSIELGAVTSRRWLEKKSIDPKIFDYLYLGITVGQKNVFYGATWAAVMMGAEGIPGTTTMQACSTATTTLFDACMAVEVGHLETPYCLFTDRLSNGPHTIWPNPKGPGAQVISENWTLDAINADPATGKAMIITAENVVKEAGFTREQADNLVLRRYEQYTEALANDREFQKRYMMPVEIALSKRKTVMVEADEGITETTREGISRLRPVQENGIHTYATQTFPADGNAGIIVTTEDHAKALCTDKNIPIQVISYGFAREKSCFMPKAPVPAARMALEKAGLTIDDIKTLKTHNPFAANDLFMAKAFDLDVHEFNNYGSSMIWGHPQAPTVARLLIEGIEEAVEKGGGYVMVSGCAAGDTGAALIVKVG